MPAEDPASSAAAARATLAELGAITVRSGRVVHAGFTRVPLLLWGVAWLVGYAGLDLLRAGPALVVGGAAMAAAAVGTWLSRSCDVVSGWQRRTRLSWLVLMACSVALVATLGDVPLRVVVLVLGVLWGIALLLFAVATGDRVLGFVGTVVVVCGPVARIFAHDRAALVFGVVAGGAMAVLGLVRTLRRADR